VAARARRGHSFCLIPFSLGGKFGFGEVVYHVTISCLLEFGRRQARARARAVGELGGFWNQQ
jgi:hypothetical protein